MIYGQVAAAMMIGTTNSQLAAMVTPKKSSFA